MAKRNAKVIKYRKPWNLNVGVVIFAFIFIYLIASVAVYMTKEKIHIYEVTDGSLTAYADYQALILRDETVTTSKTAGYISYYVRDGRKVGVNDLVYAVDETGRMQEMLDQNTGVSSLPAEDLKEFKSEAAQFALSYDPMDFAGVYDMKSSMQSSLLEYVNANALEELSDQISDADASTFVKAYASASGVVSTVLDGMEGMAPEQVTKESFDASLHPRTILSGGQGVESGTPVYKTVHSEDWNLVFQISDADIERFQGRERLSLTFKGSSLKVSGPFEIFTGADGNRYGKITLNQYMVQFVNKRYANVQIETENVRGLKIPKSALVYKNFFKVPKSCLTADGELLTEGYGEDGSVTVEKVKPVTYSSDEEYCYLDADTFRAGQYLILEDSNERFQLAATEQLPGVYNINKGYAVFRKVRILEESEEYLIISSQESSVSIYDHIVLNGERVAEDQIIFY